MYPDMSLIPEELREEVLQVAQQYDTKLLHMVCIGESGGDMVRVHVQYPGNIIKVDLNCEMKEENKALIEDLILASIDRAYKKLDAEYKNMLHVLAQEIRDRVNNYLEKHPEIDEKNKKEIDNEFLN